MQSGRRHPLHLDLLVLMEDGAVSGQLHRKDGAAESFMGWLEFSAALQRLHEASMTEPRPTQGALGLDPPAGLVVPPDLS